MQTRTILQIHDELLFEGPAGEAAAAVPIIEAEMVGALTMDPPLVVDSGIGPNWLEAK
jgi:DNA polymerase-1